MASILRYSMLQLVAVALLVGNAFSQNLAKPTLDPQRLQNIQKRLQEFVDKGLSAGAVTMVLQDGKTIQSTAVGMQNIEEHKPMKQDSIFQIMSMTKPFTAVGIMMLAEEGKISLYDNVETYLPEFRDQPLNVNGWMRRSHGYFVLSG